MKRFKLVVPSFIAIIFCMLLIAGSTFALFTSEASASISVTSGKVKVSAQLENLDLFSADATISNSQYGLAGTIGDAEVEQNNKLDNYRGTYYFEKQNGTFANGGTAILTTNPSALTLERMTPGDKVTLKLNSTNDSNVKIKTRLKITATNTNDADDNLLASLVFTLNGTKYEGLKSYTSLWTLVEAEATTANYDISIELPLLTGNDAQSEDPTNPRKVTYSFVLEAVQANAKTSGAESVDMVAKKVENYENFDAASKTVETEVVEEQTVIKNTVVSTQSEDAGIQVQVEVPANLSKNETPVLTQNSTVELTVESVSLVTDVVAEVSTVELDITLKIDNAPVKNVDDYITVTMNIGAGKEITSLKHYLTDANGDYILDDNNQKTFETITNFTYSAQTGELSFQTKSFSPFDYSYKVILPSVSVGTLDFYDNDYENGGQGALTAAVNYALENGGTVKLEKSINVNFNSTFINVPANKSLALDLNGCTINAVATASGTSAFIRNEGSLTISDSTAVAHGIGDGMMTLLATTPDTQAIPGYASNLISNTGNLTINGGKFDNTTTGAAATYVVDCYQNSTTTINGGSFYKYSTNAIRLFCNSDTQATTLVINDGVFTGYGSIWVQGPNAKHNIAHVTVNGGEFNTTEKAVVNGEKELPMGNASTFGCQTYQTSGYASNYSEDSFILINGGTFNENIEMYIYGEPYELEGGVLPQLIITGGTFNGYVYANANAQISGGKFLFFDYQNGTTTISDMNDAEMLASSYALQEVENGYYEVYQQQSIEK